MHGEGPRHAIRIALQRSRHASPTAPPHVRSALARQFSNSAVMRGVLGCACAHARVAALLREAKEKPRRGSSAAGWLRARTRKGGSTFDRAN